MSTHVNALNESLEVVKTRLAPCLLNKGNLSRMEAIAEQLPPVHRAGFEYQFLNSSGGLDFQQGISVSQTDAARLRRKIMSDSPQPMPYLWFLRRVLKLLELALNAVDSPIASLQQIWLEFDCGLELSQISPSVFLGLQYPTNEMAQALVNIENSYATLAARPLESESRGQLQRILNLGAPFGGISHLGFMLGRHHNALRVVMPLTHKIDEPRQVLEAIQPAILDESLMTTYGMVSELFPEVRLCLDILDDKTYLHGFECFFRPTTPDDRQRLCETEILEQLRKIGICTDLECDVFGSWAGQLFPPSYPQMWPEDLVISSILAAEDKFTQIETGLSHIKLSSGPHNKTIGKMYFGYRESFIAEP